MKRILTILLTFVSSTVAINAEVLSVSLSLASLEVDTPVVLVKSGEMLDMTCVFTANMSMGTLALRNALNTELDNAGITSMEIIDINVSIR